MSDMLERARVALWDRWNKLPECPGDMYSREAHELARAALAAALDPNDESLVETVARAMRQREVNAGEDGWSYMSKWDQQQFLGHAWAAISALHVLATQEKTP